MPSSNFLHRLVSNIVSVAITNQWGLGVSQKEKDAPTQNGTNNADKKHELSLLKKVCIMGCIMALVWAASLFLTASHLRSSPELLKVTQIDCQTKYNDELEKLGCTVEQLRQNQYINDAKVENLGFSVDYNSIFMGSLAAFFGALITVVVIFFALRTRREALIEAKMSAEEIIDSQREAFEEKLLEAQELLNNAHTLAASAEAQVDAVDKKLSKRVVEEDEELSPDEEARAQTAIAKPEHERTAEDWRAIAFYYTEQGLHFQASQAFSQEGSRHTAPAAIAAAMLNTGVGLSLAALHKESVYTYSKLIEWGKSSEVMPVQVSVARAWLNVGNILATKLKKNDEAIKAYRELIEWGKNSEIAFIQATAAKGWLALCVTLERDKSDPSEAIAESKLMIDWGKNSQHIEVLEEVGKSWLNLANIYQKSLKKGKLPEQTYLEILDWFKEYREKSIVKIMANAYQNLSAYILKQTNASKAGIGKAFKIIQRGYALNPGVCAYNMACIYALKGQENEALKYLNESLAAGQLPSQEHIEKDTDLDSVRETTAFKAFLAKLPKGEPTSPPSPNSN